ncbi:unnamed protein product [Pleuronectes platessa]|uniref:Uncharacterized protein n=1 Tax=Pleuronectes platessa TaxID=8262 RepID=A0A9N7YU80_PLEPL|nr:unnamed protein product [Pleuronectes platessa]
MSESEQKPSCPSTQQAEEVSESQWPENGAEWSDAEEETHMDCGLLQAMAEEDEDINVHNEETFGAVCPVVQQGALTVSRTHFVPS